MEETQSDTTKVYAYAADLMVNGNKSPEEVKQALVAKGMDATSANQVVTTLETQIVDAKKEAAKKDILYGALWCIGGTIATVADIGYIFWGAIVFGGIQLIKGLINSSN